MILTFKIKHGRDFSAELKKAKQIAEFAVKTHTLSSKDVKQFGLKSIIANQILRKYSRNKQIKKVKSVKLTVPNQGIKVDKEKREIYIPSLKLTLTYMFRNDFEKINQIEIDECYAYVSVNIPEKKMIEPKKWIGIDRNATGHIAVVADPQTGKIWKLGKKAEHIHNKYKAIRKKLQKKKKYKLLKKIKDRESRIVRDLNHKVSKKIVEIAQGENAGIKLEKLNGIRSNKKHTKPFKYGLNSWSFYQLEFFIQYKAKMNGIPLTYVDPRYTSKECSRCGYIGIREDKSFECPRCGHVDHADANASFNIAVRPPLMEGTGRLHADSDACKGSTDTPEEATPGTTGTLEPPKL
ncbi:transposase related protein [Thermoplasma acidophilum]|uniref:Transposase related protein n=1 Tax=Thermoplasma acidophilum (strain ATCC 25905 / DSM 1728 / JCM 9062 / NBRC 15155 / AMRC-C165) TaxID=273075 RepID=Q9HKW8_THEAC|nr:RNA-guided endonuclease TnpB family protein [Thermoplasma acidophilum]CAC11617.1 transposase related protein [Thermoplasma acidophilum]